MLLGLAVTGCSNKGQALESDGDDKDSEVEKKKDGDGDSKEKEEELPPVEVVGLEHGAIEAVLRFSTNLEAESEVQVVSQASRQALKQELDLEGRVILALGRIAKNKGYDLLLRAMPPVFERISDARLLLALGSTEPNDAEISQVDALRQLAHELNIADRVIFRDYVPDEWLADYYRAADVFALSSRYEPFGMTAVEAMACGTPTVVTTEGGLWEQVTWGLEALYANPFDHDAFGHAIASALQYREISDQLAKFGSQKARARFTWTGIAQQLLRLLDQSPRIGVRNAGRTAVHADDIEQLAEEESWNAEAYS